MAKHEENFRGVNTNISYFTLRKYIGWMGLLLPWIAWLVAWSYEPSISDYYYTRSGVIFTGVLAIVGVFLGAYRGYDRTTERFSDNVITWIGAFFIILVALFPTPYRGELSACPTPICHQTTWVGAIHFGSAVIFFAAMGYLSIFRFTKGQPNFSKDKIKRNRIYRFCGWGIWLTLALTGILIFGFKLDESFEHIVLWVEIVMLILFGTSWLVKGKGLVDLGIQKDDI